MEALTDPIRLGPPRAGFAMIDVLDGQVELVFVVLPIPTILRISIRKNT